MRSQSERYRQGLATRRKVLGDAHVERAQAAATDFDRPFQDLITEAAWGHVWSRPGWTKRERSIVTIALLAALGHDEEVAMHIRATLNTGATRDDIREALLHVAIYAGVPAANRAISIAKQVFQQLDAGKRRRDRERSSQPQAGNRRLLPARPRLASAGLYAGLQDLRAALAAEGAAFARQHDFGDHRPGVRPFHPRRTRQRPDPQFCQAGRMRHRRAHHRARPRAGRARPAGPGRAAGVLAGQCRRPLSPQEGNLSRAARSEFRRLRPHHYRRGRRLSLPHDPPRRLPLAERPERLASRAYPFLDFRPRLRPAADHADVFRGRSDDLELPDRQHHSRQARRRAAHRAARHGTTPFPMDARAYKFDIVLRGRRSTLFENRLEGN